VAQTIVDLFKHNLWANVRLLDACALLSAEDLAAECEGTYGALGDTIVHLLASEGRYVHAFTKVPGDLPLQEGDPPDFDVMRKRVHMSGEALIEIAGETTADLILKGEYGGRPYEMRGVMLLGQAINHATEHRAHVAAIMTQRGLTPPRMDMLGYWMAGQGG
jgi:uncharacterized damage-inducible protein DinB